MHESVEDGIGEGWVIALMVVIAVASIGSVVTTLGILVVELLQPAPTRTPSTRGR